MKKWILSFVLCLMLLAPVAALAITEEEMQLQQIGTTMGLGQRDVRLVIASIINVALGLLGIVAVVLIIYGGLLWMTAAGDEKKVDKAKGVLTMAVIGLVIILSAYAIARFVVSSLLQATSS